MDAQSVEFLDDKGNVVASSPASRTERISIDTGIDSVTTTLYIVPSPHKPDPNAAAKLLEQRETHDAHPAVHLPKPPAVYNVRLRAGDKSISEPVPLFIPSISSTPK